MLKRLMPLVAAAILALPPTAAQAGQIQIDADELKMLRERIEKLEKRQQEMEKEVKEEHKPLLAEIADHITTLEKDLDMVDYRTARIKALGERVESFSIGGDLTFFLQGVGKNSQGLREKADASYSGDLFLLVPAGPNGNIYFRGDIGQGEGIAPFMPNTFSGPNADLEFNEPQFTLAEAWYSTSFPLPDVKDQRLELTIGKMDPTALFDANAAANSETSQFVADIFVNNLAIEFGGDDNGYGPGVSLGYRFTSIYDKGNKITGRIGLFEGDGDFKDVMDRPFMIAELDAEVPFYGLKGNYRAYAWTNKTKHADLLDPADDDNDNKGFGLSIDQQVSNDVTLFARYGMQDEKVSQFDQVFTVGGQMVGNAWKRNNDVIGVAYGASHVSDDFKDATAQGLVSGVNYVADASFEHYVEAYYRYWANKNLSLSPHVQYIINPGGDEDKDDVLIYGMRMQLTF